MRIGLTGGIGSGKSEVARIFADLGAFVIDADISARQAVAPGSPGLAALGALWPQVIFHDGTLDRTALGRIVFADDDARSRLEAIVHPLVRAIGEEREAQAKPGQIIVHVVPLLFEAGFAGACDRTIVVIASEQVRLARVRFRDGLDAAAVHARMARQISPEIARTLADDVIENNADLPALQKRSTQLFEHLKASV